ncbi:hypothetical protein C2857_006514 [Epichloe festucae Fl1]|uniref:Uncharacterized protein n=1 Tax=Epichloe festucae (strain Fl1) TaxID=877507 RepID=A0A7S9PSP9_EPIFF|nr:hypothetical protein C2857_006514 [Epichloe festucae Fl1]
MAVEAADVIILSIRLVPSGSTRQFRTKRTRYAHHTNGTVLIPDSIAKHKHTIQPRAPPRHEQTYIIQRHYSAQKSASVYNIVMDSKDQNKNGNDAEKEFSIQPIKDSGNSIDPKFAPHQAHPGPALTQNMPAHEGSKEDRQARKEELNK